jgi:hypothetical protein
MPQIRAAFEEDFGSPQKDIWNNFPGGGSGNQFDNIRSLAI